MGCIKHSMMFEAQMTANSQYSVFPEEKKVRAKWEEKEEVEEGTPLVSECGDIVSEHLVYWNNQPSKSFSKMW